MRQQRLELELRMTRDVNDIAQDGLVPCIVLDELVVGARRHAVGGGQHEIARQRDAAAEVSPSWAKKPQFISWLASEAAATHSPTHTEASAA
jgi:hypothetical protein